MTHQTPLEAPIEVTPLPTQDARMQRGPGEGFEPPTKLLNRNFVLQWQGQTVSRLGSQAFSIAMLFWIKHATGSAALMGILTMLSTLPAVFLGPIGGAIADRYSRRNIIFLSDLSRGVAVLALTALIFLVPEQVTLILVGLFVVSLFNAAVGSVFSPAISSSIPDIVPTDKVAAANSLGQLSIQMSVFLGQGLGGILYRVLGPVAMFFVNGLSFLYAGISETFVVIPQDIPDRSQDWRQQFRDFITDLKVGLRYVWSRPGLRETVLVSALLTFFASPIIILLPFYVEDVLRVRIDWYGFILASYGVGTLSGYVFAGAVRMPAKVRGNVMLFLIILQAVGFILLGLVKSPWAALGLAFVGGFGSGFINVNITTLLQTTTPGQIRGRVFGLLTALSASLAPIAMGLAGIVADLVDQNIPLIYVACGTSILVVSLAIITNKAFRSFLASDYTERSPAMAASSNYDESEHVTDSDSMADLS